MQLPVSPGRTFQAIACRLPGKIYFLLPVLSFFSQIPSTAPEDLWTALTVLEKLTLALEASKSIHGEESETTLSMIMQLGSCYVNLGQYEEAISLLKPQILATTARVLGTDSFIFLSMTNAIAITHMTTGKFVEALPHLRLVGEASKRNTAGNDSLPPMIESCHNLGKCLLYLGIYNEALPLLEFTMKESERALHPDTLDIRGDWAECLMKLDRLEEARTAFEHVIDLKARRLGRNDPSTLCAMMDLGTCLGNMGKSDEALPMLRMVAETCRQTLGADNNMIISSESRLAACLSGIKIRTVATQRESLSLFQHVLEVRQRLSLIHI